MGKNHKSTRYKLWKIYKKYMYLLLIISKFLCSIVKACNLSIGDLNALYNVNSVTK